MNLPDFPKTQVKKTERQAQKNRLNITLIALIYQAKFLWEEYM